MRYVAWCWIIQKWTQISQKKNPRFQFRMFQWPVVLLWRRSSAARLSRGISDMFCLFLQLNTILSENFEILSMNFQRSFIIVSPWKSARPFIWINFIPRYTMMLCAKFYWIGPSGCWEDDFLFRQCIFVNSLLSSLGKDLGSSFEQTLIPFTQECFVSSLVEIDPVVLEKGY